MHRRYLRNIQSLGHIAIFDEPFATAITEIYTGTTSIPYNQGNIDPLLDAV